MERSIPTLTALTTDTPTDWDDLSRVVDGLVDADDPRLPTLVLELETRVGCGLGSPDRSAPMLGRRFARAQRIALTGERRRTR